MILRASIVLLLMLNLGAAAWQWFGGGSTAAPESTASNPGTPGLRLLSEVAPSPARPVQATETAAASAPMTAALETSGPATPAAGGRCLRFGPFADAAQRDAARPALATLASAVVARDLPGRASRGWWVYVPALPSRDEARAVGERIKAAGITDWYVMGEGDQANSIALGRYGSETAARRREAEIRVKGFAAQAAPLGDRAPQWWLYARANAGAPPAAFAAIAPHSEIPCTELR